MLDKGSVATIGTVLYDATGVAFTIKKENSWTGKSNDLCRR
jgi:hypothetical protein